MKTLTPTRLAFKLAIATLLTWGGKQGANGGGAGITTLASFSSSNGAGPYAGLLLGQDGNFYGTTYQGGTNGLPLGYGTAFKLTPGGALTTLVCFNNSNGAKPYAGLVQAADGNLYGVTWQGGASNLGVLFRLTTNGNLTPMLSFTGANGAKPSGRLLYGANGLLYGTTQSGGTSNLGTVFQTTTSGVLNPLVSFNGTNGANPYAGLMLGADGHLYGTTVNGGLMGKGTAFRVTTNGVLTTLISFAITNGTYPYGGLVQDVTGDLYGTTAYGGTYNAGTIYRLTTNGTLTTLYSFTGGIDGANPWASLIRGRDGHFYSTTILGGASIGVNGWGTIFQIMTNGTFTSLLAFAVDDNGISPYSDLVQDATGHFYGTTFSLGAGLKGTVFKINATPGDLPSPSVIGNSLRVNWNAWPGISYQVQYKTNLNQGGWLDLGGAIIATNGAMNVSDPIVGGTRCYRVKQLSVP